MGRVVLALSFTLCGCTAAQGDPAKPSRSATPAANPETAADVLALAERAMAKEPGWGFAVTSREGVTVQGQDAGVGVEDSQLTLSGPKETLVLDSATYRIESHRFTFQIHVPNNGRDIYYGQDVREQNKGTFDGDVRLPAGVARAV